MNRAWIAATALGLALVGCHATEVAQADPVEPNLDESFVLAGGREATIKGANLELRFTDVLEDSRCPKQVECFWTGQARVELAVQPAGQPPTKVQFNTNPAPGQNVQTARADGYVITLESLDPYPQTPDDSPSLGDYQATLSVRKV